MATGTRNVSSPWQMALPELGSAPRVIRHHNTKLGRPVYSPGTDGYAAGAASNPIPPTASNWPAATQTIEPAHAASASLRPGPAAQHGLALRFHGWGQPLELVGHGLQVEQQACQLPAALAEAATLPAPSDKAVPAPLKAAPPPPPPPPPPPLPPLPPPPAAAAPAEAAPPEAAPPETAPPETAKSAQHSSVKAPGSVSNHPPAKFDAEASPEHLWVQLDGGPCIPGTGTICEADSWLMWGLDPLTSPTEGSYPDNSLGHCLGNVKPAIHIDWVYPSPSRSNRSWDIHFSHWTSLRSFLLYLHRSHVVWPGETVHVVAYVKPYAFQPEFGWYAGLPVMSMAGEKVWSIWCEMAGHGHGASVIWCGPEQCIWASAGTGPKEEARRQFPGLMIDYIWPPFPCSQTSTAVQTGWRLLNWDAVRRDPAYLAWMVHDNVIGYNRSRPGPSQLPAPPPPFDVRHLVIYSQPVA